MAGADPSFTEVHVLRTLLILHSGVVGRKKLVKLVGIGEGSVRTIIKRLASKNLVTSSKLGHSLTREGEHTVALELKKMSKPLAFDSGGFVSGQQSLVLVYGAADKVGDGVILRDVALKAGADGAVILIYDGGIRFPGSGLELDKYPKVKEKLNEIDFKGGDVAVIGFASSNSKAEDGAVAVALKLLN